MFRGQDQLITQQNVAELADQIKNKAHKLESPDDLDPLLTYIGDARYVLLGEASHGTSEYYTWRTRLSQRLIREMGRCLPPGRDRG